MNNIYLYVMKAVRLRQKGAVSNKNTIDILTYKYIL